MSESYSFMEDFFESAEQFYEDINAMIPDSVKQRWAEEDEADKKLIAKHKEIKDSINKSREWLMNQLNDNGIMCLEQSKDYSTDELLAILEHELDWLKEMTTEPLLQHNEQHNDALVDMLNKAYYKNTLSVEMIVKATALKYDDATAIVFNLNNTKEVNDIEMTMDNMRKILLEVCDDHDLEVMIAFARN